MKTALYIPSGLIVYLIVTGLLYSTAHTRAVKNGDALVFGPTPLVRSLILALILGFACAAVYVTITPPRSQMAAMVFTVIAVAGTLAYPSEVSVTKTGVEAIRWWGTTSSIPWNEIRRIEYHKGPATTVVIGITGTKIVHSGWNRDSKGFIASCEERTGLVPVISEM